MRLLAVVFTFVMFTVAIFLLLSNAIDQSLSDGNTTEWLQKLGPAAGLIGVALLSTDVLLPIPATPIMVGLGQVYGGLVGGLYASAGNITAGLIAYGLFRCFGRDVPQRFLGERDTAWLESFFQGVGIYAIGLTRIIPIVSEVICCLAGSARMPLGRFILALVLGGLPPAFLLAYAGAQIENLWLTTVGLTACALAIKVIARRWCDAKATS